MKFNTLVISLAVLVTSALAPVYASDCRIVSTQCLDSSATKTIDGVTFKLSEVCAKLGLSGSKCCWNSQSTLYCGDTTDTCGSLRKNPNCVIQDNQCLDKDYISGTCHKFQSTYSCASGFENVESTICTNVVCANNESGTAGKCFMPPQPSKDNESNMGTAIAYLAMAQNMGQAMKCADPQHPDPETCSLFSGKYNYCYMYLADPSQPDSFYNNGADCNIHKEYFDQTGTPIGYAASDRALYSQATSTSTNIMGGVLNYGLSNDDTSAINNSLRFTQTANNKLANPDEETNYNPNSSRNRSIQVAGGQITSTINKDKIKDISAFTSFKSYLKDTSVNLAWNRMKAEPNPNNVKNTTLGELGVTRRASAQAFNWHGTTSQPIINGLCVHFGDYCDGGDSAATDSDLVKSELASVGAYSNANFCAKCGSKVAGKCLTGAPKPTKQQWCCFDSKVALDINLAAYDQGLINFYTGNDRYGSQLKLDNNLCGGVKVADIEKINFAKGDYFRDLMNSLDMDKLMDMNNFTNSKVMDNTKNRSQQDANKFVDEWKKKQQ